MSKRSCDSVDLLLLGDIVALHVVDVIPKYSPSIPVRSNNSLEVWDTFRDARDGVFGRPQGMLTDMDEEWGNEGVRG